MSSGIHPFQIENLTVSFSDGRALCFILHHYYPSFMPREEILMKTTTAQQQTNGDGSLDDSFGTMTYTFGQDKKLYEELLGNEKRNFKLFYDKV